METNLVQGDRISRSRPVSIALGGGSVRGLAHVGVLQALVERGFRISEIVGTSVGAVVLSFYAILGMQIPEVRSAGLSIRSSHLLWWSVLRHCSPGTRQRFSKFAGIFPEYIGRLAEVDFSSLHHGIQRIGIVVCDKQMQQEIVCDSDHPVLRVEDAVRGSAALPGLFPPWKCEYQGRSFHLVDGGIKNPLPVDALFSPPFQPVQILAVDISSKPEHREHNRKKITELRRQNPSIPIQMINANTVGGATVMYGSGYLERLVESARRDTLASLTDDVGAFPPVSQRSRTNPL